MDILLINQLINKSMFLLFLNNQLIMNRFMFNMFNISLLILHLKIAVLTYLSICNLIYNNLK